MLRKGHHNVKLDAEAWDRLITWIDINVPAYGTYHEVAPIPPNFEKRRYEAKKKYANVDEDIEAIPDRTASRSRSSSPSRMPPRPAPVTLAGWPLDPRQGANLQQALGRPICSLDLGGGVEPDAQEDPRR